MRNCAVMCSVILKFLSTPKSTFLVGGPEQIPTPAVPICPQLEAVDGEHIRIEICLWNRRHWPGKAGQGHGLAVRDQSRFRCQHPMGLPGPEQKPKA